jgi:hypothetical protein
MKISSVKVKGDNYFGFGIIEENTVLNQHDNYLCYNHRPGKMIDIRFGNVNGYREGGYGNKNTDWGECISVDDQIIVSIDYTEKVFGFELNGQKKFTREINNFDVDYVFVFDPYYKDLSFCVEYI